VLHEWKLNFNIVVVSALLTACLQFFCVSSVALTNNGCPPTTWASLMRGAQPEKVSVSQEDSERAYGQQPKSRLGWPGLTADRYMIVDCVCGQASGLFAGFLMDGRHKGVAPAGNRFDVGLAFGVTQNLA